MEAQQSLLEQLAQIFHGKNIICCRDEIYELSKEKRDVILGALFKLVKEGTPDETNTRSLTNCLSFFPHEEVLEFFQRIKTGELLRQFCLFFFDGVPDVLCLLRMSNILLRKSEQEFLHQIFTILNEGTYMHVPTGIYILRFLKNEITSPRSRETTIEDRENILNFLRTMSEETIRAILEIRPTDPFDFNDWIIKTRKIIAQYKEQQQRSE
jgi:hypothetical protein